MLQNLKVDIIYYKTGTDFEMEFNLGGCCRMRILTAKTNDKKTTVQSLARAVSRSKVIMITGPLFGDNGIISMVSSAIGSKTQVLDAKNYKLNGNEEILIIEKSTPLITPEGYFGGCIIENGPQTMILLSDSKSIRKSIMKTLIHPYLEELYASEHTKKFSIEDAIEKTAESLDEIPDTIEIEDTETAQNESLEVEKEEITEEGENIADEIIEIEDSDETSEETALEEEEISAESEDDTPEEVDIILDDSDDTAEDSSEEPTISNDLVLDFKDDSEDEVDLFFEPKKITKRKAKMLNDYYDDEDSQTDFYTDDDDEKKPTFSLDFPILIISVLLLFVIAILCYCIFFVPTKYGVASTEYINEIFETLF